MPPKPKAAPEPKQTPVSQSLALASSFGDAEFTAREAGPVLFPKMDARAAGLAAGRALKKLADEGLIERKPGNKFRAGTSAAEARQKASERPATRQPTQPAAAAAAANPPASGNGPGPCTPPMKLNKARREEILKHNLPPGVGLHADEGADEEAEDEER